MKKRNAVITASLAAMLALSACSGNSGSGNNVNGNKNGNDPAATNDAATDEPAAPLAISMA
ncbi:sugar ABC transporter substrate-binding protein, partial [Paenibacillus sp. MCAF20]